MLFEPKGRRRLDLVKSENYKDPGRDSAEGDDRHPVLRLRGGGDEDDVGQKILNVSQGGWSNNSETAHDSEAEDLELYNPNNSVSASFKMFCYNNTATSVPLPETSEDEESE